MKNEPHVIESENPLIENSTYTVLCGKEIERAKFVAGWDVLEIGVRLKDLPKGICSKCRQRWEDMSIMHLEEIAERHFIYAIRSSKKDQDEIEAA